MRMDSQNEKVMLRKFKNGKKTIKIPKYKMKISIITPTYNSEKDILRTIKSIKKQNIHNKECFFIDAKSEDNTIKIIKKKYQI